MKWFWLATLCVIAGILITPTWKASVVGAMIGFAMAAGEIIGEKRTHFTCED